MTASVVHVTESDTRPTDWRDDSGSGRQLVSKPLMPRLFLGEPNCPPPEVGEEGSREV
jgi:hypothetical protein